MTTDPEAFECLECGNSTALDGFMQSSHDGVPAWLGTGPKPFLLAKLPTGFFTCHVCGTIYTDPGCERVGQLSAPALRSAQDRYWKLNGF